MIEQIDQLINVLENSEENSLESILYFVLKELRSELRKPSIDSEQIKKLGFSIYRNWIESTKEFQATKIGQSVEELLLELQDMW